MAIEWPLSGQRLAPHGHAKRREKQHSGDNDPPLVPDVALAFASALHPLACVGKSHTQVAYAYDLDVPGQRSPPNWIPLLVATFGKPHAQGLRACTYASRDKIMERRCTCTCDAEDQLGYG